MSLLTNFPPKPFSGIILFPEALPQAEVNSGLQPEKPSFPEVNSGEFIPRNFSEGEPRESFHPPLPHDWLSSPSKYV